MKIILLLTLLSTTALSQETCKTLIDRTKHYIDIRCVKGKCEEQKRTNYLQIVECKNPDGSITERTVSREE